MSVLSTFPPFTPLQHQKGALAQRRGGLAVAGRCLASDPDSDVDGGDFFDVLPLDNERVLIAVGDVVGHGPSATGRMRALRSKNRLLAVAGLSPAETLRRLDSFQCRLGAEEFATLWLGIYDRTTDKLEYASAGHPSPILAGVDHRTRLLREASAPPLGSGYVGRHIVVDSVQFTAGALLVAYSDGLIERVGHDIEHQIEALRYSVEQAYEPTFSQTALEYFVDLTLEQLRRSPTETQDDICILAAHHS